MHAHTWEKGSRSCFWLLPYNVTTVLRMLTKLITLQQGWYSAVNSFLIHIHYLSNVHTWAIFFLRHLANMSSMVPFWASTDSSFVPNLGPASEATPSIHVLFLTIHLTSFILIIHHIRTSNHSFYLHDKIHSFISSVLHSRPAALGLSCPIQ